MDNPRFIGVGGNSTIEISAFSAEIEIVKLQNAIALDLMFTVKQKCQGLFMS